MKRIILVSITILLTNLVAAQNISEQLFNLPNVIFNKVLTPVGYEGAYELKIKQPLDHNDK